MKKSGYEDSNDTQRVSEVYRIVLHYTKIHKHHERPIC